MCRRRCLGVLVSVEGGWLLVGVGGGHEGGEGVKHLQKLDMRPSWCDSHTTPDQQDRVASAWVFPAMGTRTLRGRCLEVVMG